MEAKHQPHPHTTTAARPHRHRTTTAAPTLAVRLPPDTAAPAVVRVTAAVAEGPPSEVAKTTVAAVQVVKVILALVPREKAALVVAPLARHDHRQVVMEVAPVQPTVTLDSEKTATMAQVLPVASADAAVPATTAKTTSAVALPEARAMAEAADRQPVKDTRLLARPRVHTAAGKVARALAVEVRDGLVTAAVRALDLEAVMAAVQALGLEAATAAVQALDLEAGTAEVRALDLEVDTAAQGARHQAATVALQVATVAMVATRTMKTLAWPLSEILVNVLHFVAVTYSHCTGTDFPTFDSVPDTGFSCSAQQFPGYYADVDAGCQVLNGFMSLSSKHSLQAFYICQSDGRQDGFLCPNATLFNQQFFVCDWWYNVGEWEQKFECGFSQPHADCASAPSFYGLNADLYSGGGNSYGGGSYGSSGGGSYGGSSGGGGGGYSSRSGDDSYGSDGGSASGGSGGYGGSSKGSSGGSSSYGGAGGSSGYGGSSRGSSSSGSMGSYGGSAGGGYARRMGNAGANSGRSATGRSYGAGSSASKSG